MDLELQRSQVVMDRGADGLAQARTNEGGIAGEESSGARASNQPIPLGRVGRGKGGTELATFLTGPHAISVSEVGMNLDVGMNPRW